MKALSILYFLLLTSFITAQSKVTEPTAGEDNKVYKKVQQMPIYPGCDIPEFEEKDRRICTDNFLRKFITENLVYPIEALKYQREGMTVVNFQIGKDGAVQNVKCIRDMGLGTGQAAIDVIEKMEKSGIVWNPGYEDGEPKIVAYIFPISFTLPRAQAPGR